MSHAVQMFMPDPARPSTWAGAPTWLRTPPSGEVPNLPLETKAQLLPCADLSWEDFERLCLRLLEREAEVIHAAALTGARSTAPVTRPYGARGQSQAGI